MPKISVVMPVYNQKEEYLRESIESILNQTYSDFEFIIVNDGSTNNSEEVILSYSDNRIVYIKQENQGVARSLNNGIDAAKGEYIARMDSDDISLPERFEKQVKFLDEHPEISILGTACEKFPKHEILRHPIKPRVMDCLKGCCMVHPTIMMRKSDLNKYDLRYDSSFTSEDYELWSRAVRYVNLYNMPEVLLKYRCHEDNISNIDGIFIDSDKKIKQNLLNFLSNNAKMQDNLSIAATKEELLYKPFEKLFSIKNLRLTDKKYKVITVLGNKVYLNN